MNRTKEGITLERTDDVVLIGGMKKGCLELKKIRFLVDHTMKISVIPKMKDQRLKGAVSYWEGATQMNLGKDAGEKGKGYLEVTGLDKKTEEFRNNELCQSKEKSP